MKFAKLVFIFTLGFVWQMPQVQAVPLKDNKVQRKAKCCQVQRLKRPAFNRLDKNANGQLEFNEFARYKLPLGKHKRLFRLIDENNDGKISRQEFVSHQPPRHLKKLFESQQANRK
ncbi:hypothetical protein C2869_11970 [Saccharobesus litoralis]|uniref:EF-hand domain-containing protein n=1 Tax=Saccharobesus litoralis TaxID=2172099 RepID=A0A2S0VSB3_9ALTE|nr:EF-hand domain-containing protein [Saccharobesus litoralis]AWB67105.1 hypothetical protein C2869_11970 [Saccharobesus litoralis]